MLLLRRQPTAKTYIYREGMVGYSLLYLLGTIPVEEAEYRGYS
jgi:hypothetical protein